MGHTHPALIATLMTVGLAWPARSAAVNVEDLSLRDDAKRASAPPSSRFPRFGIGVRVGVAQASLKSRRLPGVAEVVSDDVNDAITMVTPSAHIGGDRFFFKLDAPLMRWDGGYTVGLGVYPLNYGRYFPRSKLLPYGSAGGAVSAATMKPSSQDTVQVPLRALMVQGRMAAGLKWRAVPGVALSLEAGFSPYAAGGVVDNERRKAAEAAVDAGKAPDLTPGNRPVNAGIGQVMDLALGVEWL